MHLRFVVVCAALLIPLAGFAQDDEPGTKDHPDVPRFPSFYITEAEEREFSNHEFLLSDSDKYEKKEGKYWRIRYSLKEGAKQPGAVEVARNYENAFKKKGGRAVYKHDDGSSAWFTLKMPLGKSERWMEVHAASGWYDVVIVDVKAMVQQLEVTASEMLDTLNRDGFIALYGILFDTNKDVIKPESEALLDEIVTLLKDNAGLKLSVEGHTDNVGQAKANLALSDKRAASVKKYLVGKGVDGKRLSTKGWGDTKPVADNRTEDGRTKNRRVELVKK